MLALARCIRHMEQGLITQGRADSAVVACIRRLTTLGTDCNPVRAEVVRADGPLEFGLLLSTLINVCLTELTGLQSGAKSVFAKTALTSLPDRVSPIA